jgi:Ca2+-binding RTX toxin-like protein
MNAAGVQVGYLNYDSSYADITTALASGTSFSIDNHYSGTTLTLKNVENWSVLAGSGDNDLLMVHGTDTTYDGGGGMDTLYANASAATSAITWDNDASKSHTLNGATFRFSTMEKLLISTGSGNDSIDNTIAATDDYIDTGAGNDTIKAGAGTDTINGGAGDDIIDGGAGIDSLIGGDGSDTYYVDNVNDVVSETNALVGTGGADLVNSALDAGFEVQWNGKPS